MEITMQIELQTAQERLRIIDTLSNTLAPESELTNEERAEVAYFIHEICDGLELSSDVYRRRAGFQIASKKSLFVQV
jgi:hypothetical protein